MNMSFLTQCKWGSRCKTFCVQEFHKSWQRILIYSILCKILGKFKISKTIVISYPHHLKQNYWVDCNCQLDKERGIVLLREKNGQRAEHRSKCNLGSTVFFGYINKEYQAGEESWYSGSAFKHPVKYWSPGGGQLEHRSSSAAPPQEGS